MLLERAVLHFNALFIAGIVIISCDGNRSIHKGLIQDNLTERIDQTIIQMEDLAYQVRLEASDLSSSGKCYEKWNSFDSGRIEVWSKICFNEAERIDKSSFILYLNVIDEDRVLDSDSINKIRAKFESEYLYPNFTLTKVNNYTWSYVWADI